MSQTVAKTIPLGLPFIIIEKTAQNLLFFQYVIQKDPPNMVVGVLEV